MTVKVSHLNFISQLLKYIDCRSYYILKRKLEMCEEWKIAVDQPLGSCQEKKPNKIN